MKRLTFFFCFVLGCNVISQAQVRLPRLVQDSMILQRDVRLKIWGWAKPGEKIKIAINGKTAKAVTDPEGKWTATLPPLKAGGPYTMDISGSNKITLKNVLVGDVWFCSGQSNMYHYLEIHRDAYAKEIAAANYPEIRQFQVPQATNLMNRNEDFNGGSWKTATEGNILKFSVVAYFFALKLYEKYHVPVGIINASVGGTPIEAWTAESGLQDFPAMVKTINANKDSGYVNKVNREADAKRIAQNKARNKDKGMLESVRWYDPNYVPKNWHTINIPGYWEDQGVHDLDGVVWYRREVEVPTEITGIPVRLNMGRIIDADAVYINGVAVGSTGYQYPQRRYELAPGVLKPGKNLFVIRVVNNSGKGGFVPDKPYNLSAAGRTVDLKGEWLYRVGEVYADKENIQGISKQNQPSALFNGMVAPATNYAIKGFVWYQGESNVTRAQEYKDLHAALIKNWRAEWKHGELPFFLVQLPNFQDVDYSPVESQWAVMREAQLKTTKLPKVGMAVAIDLGEWNDIHPDNKKPVGERLALEAERIAYGENILSSGPLYESNVVEGSKVIITFTNVGSGLISKDAEPLCHFAIAGKDKKFVWANAIIKDNKVEVSSYAVPEPMYVRYAWSDNPDCANLSNKEGLPASPFRTDE